MEDQHKTRVGFAAALSLAILVAVALTARNGSSPTAGLGERVYLPLVASNYPTNLLANPGFESGLGGHCRYYDAYGIERHGCFIEQRVGAGWTLVWRQDQGGELCHSGVTGRPEANLSDKRHPEDVYSGEYSAHAFTFWRCAALHWEQPVATEPGRRYVFGGYVRTWPGNPEMRARLCAGNVCSLWESTNGAWTGLAIEFEAVEASTAVRMECAQSWPEKNGDCWLDATWLFLDN